MTEGSIMKDFNPTPDKTLKILQTVSNHLKSKPLAFEAEGVFRVSGSQTKSEKIIEDILENRRFIQSTYSIHDYIDAIKIAIRKCTLVDPNDGAIIKLKGIINADESEVDTKEKTKAVNDFIKQYALSKDLNKFIAAEILHNYLHLLMHAWTFKSKNKMTSENLGLITGPLFANLLEADLKLNYLLTLKLNLICGNMLSDGTYINTFEATYPDETANMRKRELEELQTKRLALLATRTQKAQLISDYDNEIAACNEQLKTVKKGGNTEVITALKKTIVIKRTAITALKMEDRKVIFKQLQDIEKRINSLKDEKPYQDKSKLLVFSKRKAASFDLTTPEPPQSLKELVQEKKASTKPN